jgi:ferritin-like metal-binding protein YciE
MNQNYPQSGLLRDNLNKLLIENLEIALAAEKALLDLLPSFAKAAYSREATATFDLYAAQAEEHICRLKKITHSFESAQPPARFCELLTNGRNIVETLAGQPVTADAALISAARRIVDHQIAFYETLCAMAAADDEFYMIARSLRHILKCENERQHILSELSGNFQNESSHAENLRLSF